ncbi:fumarylacetoacetase [Exophiala aquamarina CBS 119918]|uniref:Fumarylacetoacetase n=1 Tax=Exophiala aquamarina CBS 119918 TaxID=1182545 RepID=A0A072PB82_9EURO|nr:fumarylacetoacetase [Exophiala aquamarina CBS 119918]KEF57344.1 fumarylacetoacetase [Exophiala aquamarina CBS 119918]
MGSWIEVSKDSDFSLQNLPYGIFSTNGTGPRIGVAIGEHVLDLKVLAQDEVFADLKFDATTLEQTTLNAYAALRRGVHRAVRSRVQQILQKETQYGDVLRDNEERRKRALTPLSSVTMHLPMAIGDYTDFFVGLHHAVNCANVIAPGKGIEGLCPAFFHLPVAYHGRASSVVPSGTKIRRPNGQMKVDDKVIYGPCQKLDFEIEFAAFISHGNELGSPIPVDEAEDHIFGFVLLNDLSARDIQAFEATIMGPFQGKNFGTSISPWIVPFDALEPFRTAPKEPRQLAQYLTEKKTESAYNLPIRASLEVDSQKYHMVEGNTNNVIFSFAQMIAHHTRGGCPLRTGDLIGTGTVSGPEREQIACLLELSLVEKEGTEFAALDASIGTVRRTFLEDGDVVEFTAQAKSSEGNVGFGHCRGQILPALES